MKLLDNETMIISKSLFKKIKNFYGDIFEEPKTFGKEEMMVNTDEIRRVLNTIRDDLRITNVKYTKQISGVDKSNFEEYISMYEDFVSRNARNKANGSINYNLWDDIIDTGLDAIEEKRKITSVPTLVTRIKKLLNSISKSNIELKNIKLSDRNYNILNDYNLSELKNQKYEDYKSVEDTLTNIISSTYDEKLSNVSSALLPDELRLIVFDGRKTHLMTEKNLKSFSYGLIMDHRNNIKKATNKDSEDTILPYDLIDKNYNFIELKEFKPIARFAVTLGEKSLNPNYVKAQMFSPKYQSLPLIEFDITKYISKNECAESYKEFINRLFEDKNIVISKKDNDLYDKFENFNNEYTILKSRRYDECNIRNLFDTHVKLITSSEVCNLDNLLKNYSTNEIETVLKHNQFMDYNIFRYSQVDKSMIERFIDKFYTFRLDEKLNRIYIGFKDVLDYLKNLSDEELKEEVEKINSTGKVDSWLIAQRVNPTHKKIKKNLNVSSEVNNFGEFQSEYLKKIQSEKERLLEQKQLLLKEYLSSHDVDKERVMIAA